MIAVLETENCTTELTIDSLPVVGESFAPVDSYLDGKKLVCLDECRGWYYFWEVGVDPDTCDTNVVLQTNQKGK